MRCPNSPLVGIDVCQKHGGNLPAVRAKSARHIVSQQIKDGVFWQGEAPILDPGDALVRIASRLVATAENLSQRMDEAMSQNDKRGEGSPGVCECCGYDWQMDIVPDKTLVDLWKFTTGEAAKLMAQIQRIGIAERSVRLQEAQVLVVAQGISAMFEHLGLTEEQQIEGRRVLLERMKALEEAPKHGDDPESALRILEAEVVDADGDPLDWLA